MSKSEKLNGLQKCIIDSLKVFHDFCEENELDYYLTGGTLLGAVRHQGIIPWDDDIDVCMPREDYKRLMSLAENLPAGFSIGYYSLDKKYVYPFAKFYNDKILVKEYFGDKSYTNGVWVDIFPLDATFTNPILRKLHFYIVKKIRFLFQLKVRGYQAPTDKSNIFKYGIKRTIKPIVFAFLQLLPLKILFNTMEKIASIKDFKNSGYRARLYSRYGVKATFHKRVYSDKILLDFNGYQFYAPAGYDEYLTNLYGDYMTPPPPKERQTHNIEIVSLKD